MLSSLQRITRPGTKREHFLTYREGPEGTVEIVDINVFDPDRRKGIGSEMICELCNKVGYNRCVYLFTRKSNKGAQAFYQAMGFTKTALLPGFYNRDGRKENALIMTLHL